MIEKDLEDRIVAAIAALGVRDLTVIGAWDEPDDETSGTVMTITVTVSSRSYSRFTVCEATFPVSLELAASSAADADGSRFVAAATAVSDLLHSWNMNRSNEAKTALSIDGVLAVGGIRVAGGGAPYLDRAARRRSVSFNFEAKGFIAHNTNTTNTQGE